jgi:hypothetical protein
MSKLPGLWYRKLDDQWEIWVNGQKEPLRTEHGMSIDPYDCYVQFNGWPAGLFSIPTGEGCISAGGLANYETFCDALERAAQPKVAA